MLYVSDNKSQITKGDFHPAQFYKGDKKIAGYVKEAFEGEGTVTLENCYNDMLHNAKIYGNMGQDGIPSPDNPVEMKSVGELVSEGEYSGKYKISIKASSGNEEQIFDVYLNAPLRKVGDYADYIDFEKGVVVRNLGQKIFTGAESWVAHENNLGYFFNNPLPEVMSSAAINVASNYLPSENWNTLYYNQNKSDGTLTVGVAGSGYRPYNERYIFVCPYSSAINPEEWKEKLTIWYEEGNPFTILYAMATTEEEIELPEIPTMRGTTTFEVLTEISAKINGEYKRMEE